MSIISLFKRTTSRSSNPALEIPHDAEGQYRLGCKYVTGQGVDRDYVLAYKWLSFAVAQGHPGAIEMRDSIADRMNPQQIAEGERLAIAHAPAKLAEV